MTLSHSANSPPREPKRYELISHYTSVLHHIVTARAAMPESASTNSKVALDEAILGLAKLVQALTMDELPVKQAH